MIEHMVWFKLKDTVDDTERRRMLEGLRALPAQIPEIEYLACGEDFSGRSRGFHMGLIVRVNSREALQRYLQHPAHQTFLDLFRDDWDDVMALDFENPGAV